jgi:hypothetical protein
MDGFSGIASAAFWITGEPDCTATAAADTCQSAGSHPTLKAWTWRDHDAAGWRFGLQTCCDVDPIAVKVFAIDDQVAKMKPDPEHDGSVLSLMPIGLGHDLLELNGCTDLIYRTGELNQCTIASQLDQPAAMGRQYRLQAFGKMEPEASKRTVLLASHQARVASDIRRQNSCQSSHNPFSGHGAIPEAEGSCAAAL